MRSMHITLVVDASEGANLYGILEGRLSGVQVRFHHRPLVDAEQSEMTISATVSGEVPALLG
ncbi:MAG: hypothetical protein GXO29_07310, partial [Thermotogae bacterium]|nr:hypothetical protein [Thermotogota bacterium]